MYLNDEQILIESKNATIPLTGKLEFDFVTSSTLTASNNRHSAHKFEQSGVHYSLDLSAKDDREVTEFECTSSRARLPLHRNAVRVIHVTEHYLIYLSTRRSSKICVSKRANSLGKIF